jgi:hypothetical protein
MCKHIVQIRRTNSEVKPHLVVVAELLHEGGLDGLGGRTVAAARVAHEDQHLLRGLARAAASSSAIASTSPSLPPPPPAPPAEPLPPPKPSPRDAKPSGAIWLPCSRTK